MTSIAKPFELAELLKTVEQLIMSDAQVEYQ